MNTPVLFSIVVPTYNRAHLISATIESILNQTYTHFELLIIDDGSNDNTEEVVKRYTSEKIFYYKKINEERASARNFGTQKAKGNYINWFDSDDIMLPDNLDEAAKTLNKYGLVEVIVQGFEYRTYSGKILHQSSFSPNINLDLYQANIVANSPVIVRRDIALANPFNENRDLSGSEDYELWLRLAAQFRFRTSDQRTVIYICHDERSTVQMTNPDQLIKRYTTFLNYTTSEANVIRFLGDHLNYFLMKSYLFLAVDLMVSGYHKLGLKYLTKSFLSSPKLIFEKGFYAFIKHFIKKSFL